MKRSTRTDQRFQIKPLKIDISPAEILADLQYGVGEAPPREGETRHRVR